LVAAAVAAFFSAPTPTSCVLAVLASKRLQGGGALALPALARRIGVEVDALVATARFKNQSSPGACSEALLL
jgi:hypothetical protein